MVKVTMGVGDGSDHVGADIEIRGHGCCPGSCPPTERPGGYGTILTRSAEAWKCFWHQNTKVNMPCHMHLYVSDP